MKLYHDFQADELCSDEELMLERSAIYLFISSLFDLGKGYVKAARGYHINKVPKTNRHFFDMGEVSELWHKTMVNKLKT